MKANINVQELRQLQGSRQLLGSRQPLAEWCAQQAQQPQALLELLLLEYLQLMALSLAQQKQGWEQQQEQLAHLERQTHLERLAWLRFDPEIATFDWADDWQLGDQPNLAGHSSRGAIGRKIAKR